MRWIVLSLLLATQSPAGPAAIASGPPPTADRPTSSAVDVDPGDGPVGEVGDPQVVAGDRQGTRIVTDAIVCSTACVAGLILETVSSLGVDDPDRSRLDARATGFVPTGTDATTFPDASSSLTALAGTAAAAAGASATGSAAPPARTATAAADGSQPASRGEPVAGCRDGRDRGVERRPRDRAGGLQVSGWLASRGPGPAVAPGC